MTDSATNSAASVAPPKGFTLVPPHLVAVNLLFHIAGMANGNRAQSIHATSRRRHKFKKLQANLKEWQKTPSLYIRDMQAKHKEWRVPGIWEQIGHPGCYMFSRAILTPTDPGPTHVQHRRSPSATVDIPVGTLQTANLAHTKKVLAQMNASPMAPPRTSNPFFSMEEKQTNERVWPMQRPSTGHPQPSNASKTDDTNHSPSPPKSPNLLDSQDEPEPTTEDASLRAELTDLRKTILDLQKGQHETSTLIKDINSSALATRQQFELHDNIHMLKSYCVLNSIYQPHCEEVFKDLTNLNG